MPDYMLHPMVSTSNRGLVCKQMRFLEKSGVALALLFLMSVLGWSDSLQLKDGHHYYGKYAGGTEGVLAFQTEGSVQYFPVSDVVLLVFSESREQAISPLSKKMPSVAPKPRASRMESKANKARLIRSGYAKAIAY